MPVVVVPCHPYCWCCCPLHLPFCCCWLCPAAVTSAAAFKESILCIRSSKVPAWTSPLKMLMLRAAVTAAAALFCSFLCRFHRICRDAVALLLISQDDENDSFRRGVFSSIDHDWSPTRRMFTMLTILESPSQVIICTAVVAAAGRARVPHPSPPVQAFEWAAAGCSTLPLRRSKDGLLVWCWRGWQLSKVNLHNSYSLQFCVISCRAGTLKSVGQGLCMGRGGGVVWRCYRGGEIVPYTTMLCRGWGGVEIVSYDDFYVGTIDKRLNRAIGRCFGLSGVEWVG